MKIYKIYPVGFAANSYIITADDRSCIVVDPGQPRIYDECKKRGLTPTYALLTHCHYDHIGGAGALFDEGCKVLCGEDEKDGEGVLEDAEDKLESALDQAETDVSRGLNEAEE